MTACKTKKGYVLATALVSIVLSMGLLLLLAKLFNNKPGGNYDKSQKIAYFHGKEYQVPPEIINSPFKNQISAAVSGDETGTDVLGSKSKNKEKRIEVNLNEQKLYAYEGDKKKMSFDVSTGKWAETPTGEYRIWTKLKYTLMTGGSKDDGTYYYLPNVPYTMYFYQGYGIHGAYWHENFGHPMSHGCVNMRISDAEKLFYWANPSLPENAGSVLASDTNTGTKVVIYGQTPKE